ncbi:MAG: hypothetical protein MN733_13370 [Nitrososphaera sp.]|nr:hypothetical protein [Nitrososphaera sp.]
MNYYRDFRHSEEERARHRQEMEDIRALCDSGPCYPVKGEYPHRGLGLIFWLAFFGLIAYLVSLG